MDSLIDYKIFDYNHDYLIDINNITNYNNDNDFKEYNCSFTECYNYNSINNNNFKQFKHFDKNNIKFRIINKNTKAGNKNWIKLIGKKLCDGCYSCYRKNGNFIRKEKEML